MTFTTVQYIRQVNVAVATGNTTQYTVNSARQDVVKCVTVCNTTSSSINFSMTMAGNSLFSTVSIPASQTLSWTGTIVLNATDTIVTSASATGLQLLVSGLESQ
jgi:hypothetical protein